MLCRLCHIEKPLLKKSHIIPDFMYADIFDKHHKLHRLAPAEYIRGTHRVDRPSSGEYESNILCRDCDNVILGKYETYGRGALYAGDDDSDYYPIGEHGVTESGVQVSRIAELNYRFFKLFLLSILWRASISTRLFFRSVKLGPYEEVLRKMIISGDAKQPHEFPILLLSWLDDDPVLSEFIGEPGINRATQGIRYVFPISGITYVYHVSPNSMPSALMPFTLLPSNTGTILYIPKGKGKELFASYFGM